MVIRFSIVLFLFFVLSGQAAVSSLLLKDGESVRVTDIADDNSLILADDRIVKLATIQMPFFFADNQAGKSWPFAEQAWQALRMKTLDQTIEIYPVDTDRHGRLISHVLTGDDWLQEELVRGGFARVAPMGQDDDLVMALLLEENAARQAGRGLWSYTAYSIKSPETLNESRGRYEIVTGVIRNATQVRNIIYLNFGDDWRDDFTVQVEKKNREAFQGILADIDILAGRRIEVRGWVRYYNGPMIDLYHKSQIRYTDKEDAETGGREAGQ